jgi:predicted nuclease with TOPRIM domain
LTETNALLEDKYKELSSSSRGVRVGSAASTGNNENLDESHSELAGRSKSELEDQQLRRDLRQREDEIEELRQRVEELEHDLGARVPVQGGTLGDVEGLKGDVSMDDSE